MTRRKRGKLASKSLAPETSIPEAVVPETTKYDRPAKGMTLKEVPLDELAQLTQRFERVAVGIKRRNNRGHLASLGWNGVLMTPQEVMDIASWIAPRGGGGIYVVDIVNPKDTLDRLLPPFEVVIEGTPKAPISLYTPLASPMSHPARPMTPQLDPTYDPTRPVPGAITPNDVPLIPGVNDMPRYNMEWSQGLHPQVRASYEAQVAQQQRMHSTAGPLAPGASIPSDLLAVDALRRAEARSAELEAKLTAMLQRAEERERALQEQLREERDKAREREHQLQLEMLRVQITQRTDNTPKRSLAEEMAPIVAALAPVLGTMVQASKESGAKSLELQQQGMQQLLNLIVAQGNKPQPDPLDTVAKLTPLLTATQKDPTANVAMVEAMGNMQLQMTGMMAQMIETFGAASSGDSTPPWLPIVQTIAQGMMQMSQAAQADQQRQIMLAQQQRQFAAPQAPIVVAPPRPAVVPGTPTQSQSPTQPAQASQSGTSGVPFHTIDNTPPPVMPAAPIKLNAAMLDLLPNAFRTQEWKGIIVGLHERKPPDMIGTVIARHIGHLDEFEMLPDVLHDYHLDPPGALRRLVQPLPIFAADIAYCEAVIEHTVQAMLEHGVLQYADPENPEDEGDEGDGDEEPANELAATRDDHV